MKLKSQVFSSTNLIMELTSNTDSQSSIPSLRQTM
jgi:hypothetical protein